MPATEGARTFLVYTAGYIVLSLASGVIPFPSSFTRPLFARADDSPRRADNRQSTLEEVSNDSAEVAVDDEEDIVGRAWHCRSAMIKAFATCVKKTALHEVLSSLEVYASPLCESSLLLFHDAVTSNLPSSLSGLLMDDLTFRHVVYICFVAGEAGILFARSIRDTNPTMPFPLPSMFRRLFPALPALSVGTERTCSAWNRHESIGMKRWPTWPDVTAVAKAPSVHLLLKKYMTVMKCRSCLVQQQ
jgi:hypothetical protein